MSTRAIVSYAIDYLIIVILAIIYAALDKLITPFSQHFSLANISIQYPYAVHERIPIYLALVISGGFPAVVIAVYTLFIDGFFSHRRRTAATRSPYSLWDRLWELNCGWLGLLLAQGAAFVITGSLKNLCGKPRPDLIDRCQPRPGAADGVPYGLATKAICTQEDEAIMQDGFRSFPSGHSSSSFAGLFFLSLYLAAKLHVLDQKGEVWRTFVVLIPTLAAACVAMSRIMDARHHPFDVLFGSALGILCAWGAYRQYFPPISHVWEKGRAYPMRAWGSPIKRPIPGKVMVDSQTLEVLVDRVSADDEEEGVSGYEMDFPSHRRGFHSRLNKQDLTSHSPNPSLDMDVETGYATGGVTRQPYSPPGPLPVPTPVRPQGTGNAFRDQIEHNRRMRAGHTGMNPHQDQGEHAASEDEDDIALRKPLHSGRLEA
ncbi:uncharacterized protein Z518_05037 [Rhinocladiella mackenziei CBS 650.93]|uniref:Phosphatidic acid phosphatase type 2/haloperoxidase domain-containing protein n=1 Tax=Rhinocladiella mackenziei CBS 650.93 TaxID=1442369 RepID=A0A0D2JD46_9EURO|nr:uncharacterized protein Z518_05037 [Rhinocladiella mackenziei CBS 650.93]KIX07060.1 hypothetical protein Z518_05037 [Rhinocladiella mackenziei CBS 650.93]